MKNSIEEDIKIVENYLANSAMNEIDSNFFKNSGWETVDLEIPKSMQHILSDYKRVLKENERYKKSDYETICLENNELREITDRIQSEYNDLMKDNFKLKNNIRKNEDELEFDVNCDWITLQKILDESEKNNEYILYKNEKWIKEKYCIPVQKVKDKIEELKQEKKKYGNCLIEMYEDELVNRDIKILQELLESEEK